MCQRILFLDVLSCLVNANEKGNPQRDFKTSSTGDDNEKLAVINI